MSCRVVAVVGALFAAAFAHAQDRSKPPAPGPVRPLHLPPIEKRALSSGVPVIMASMPEVPVVEVSVLVRAGATSDPSPLPGVALLVADMLDEGAASKDALAFEDALDTLGATLETEASWDATTVRLHVASARLAPALALLGDAVLRPDFPKDQLERRRKELLTDLLQARDEPREIARVAFARAVFGPTDRYGVPDRGDARSIAAIQATDLVAFHRARYTADRAAIVVAGDVTADAVAPLLEAAFKSWPRGNAAEPSSPARSAPKSRFVWLVDKPGAAQSVIRIGAPGPDRRTPDYVPLQVTNTLLGGSFTSRLNDNLREQHGYAYGAASRFDYRRSGGLFLATADVQTQSTAQAVSEFVKELTRIRTPAAPDEVERARNYAALGYASDFETTQQVASKLGAQWLYGLSDDELTAFVPRALAVDAASMRRVATTWIDPARLAYVVVGDRKTIEAPLRALKLGPLTTFTVDDILGVAPKVP